MEGKYPPSGGWPKLIPSSREEFERWAKGNREHLEWLRRERIERVSRRKKLILLGALLAVLVVSVFLLPLIAHSLPRGSFVERFPVTGGCASLGLIETNVEVKVFMKDYSDPAVYDYAREAVKQRKGIPTVTAGFVVFRKIPHQKRFVYEFREVLPSLFLTSFLTRQSDITNPGDWNLEVTEERFVREQAEIFSADEIAALSDRGQVFVKCWMPLMPKTRQ